MIILYGNKNIIDQIGLELNWCHLDKINILSTTKNKAIEAISRQLCNLLIGTKCCKNCNIEANPKKCIIWKHLFKNELTLVINMLIGERNEKFVEKFKKKNRKIDEK